ncbi:MAG: tetratricopeptide repeat protein [Myxococcota bacterium]
MRTLGIIALVILAVACQSPEEQVQEHWTRAQAYLDEHKLEEAKIELLNILQLDPNDSKAHYQLGETLWELKDFPEARWQYREAVRTDPENIEKRVKVAQIEVVFGRTDEALKQAEKVLQRDPKNVEAHLIHGTLEFTKGHPEELLEDVQQVLAVDPKNVAALRLKARAFEIQQKPEETDAAYHELIAAEDSSLNRRMYAVFLGAQGRNDEALENYQRAVEVSDEPEHKTTARLALANFYLNQGDIDKTEEELLAARDENPKSGPLLLQLARFYAAQDKLDQARSMLELRVQQEPDSAEPLMILADFEAQTGKPEEALKTVEKALEVDPKNELARLRKAEYLMDRSASDPTLAKEARALLASVLEDNPNSVRGLFTQAKFLLLDGRAEDAIPKLQRVVEEQPSTNAYLLLGQAYLNLRQFELARSELLRAVQLDANNVAARARLAALYLQMGERELASQEARQALARTPDDPRLQLVLAESLEGQGRMKDAVAVLKSIRYEGKRGVPILKLQAARLLRTAGAYQDAHQLLDELDAARPGDPKIVVEQALIDLFAQDLDAALERLDRAIQVNPDEARLYEMRGRVRMGITQGGKMLYPDEAEADLKRAIELDPDRAEASMQLAQLYTETGRLKDAVASYESAAKLEPGNAGLWVVLGALYEQSGRFEDAMRAYRSSTRIDPHNAIALNNLAWLLVEHGDGSDETMDRALTMAQDAKERMPQNPSVADTLGWVLLKKKVPNAAISLFKEAIEGYPKADPTRSLVRLHLAQAYSSNGEPERAIEQLKKALAEHETFPDRSKAESLLKRLETS